MSTPNVNEEIRKLDLSLQTLNDETSTQIQNLRAEFQSMIKDIESSRDSISEKLAKLNNNSREITNSSENLQKLNNEVNSLDNEVNNTRQTIDNGNKQISQIKEEFMSIQKKINEKENEQITLESSMKSLNSELDGLERINIELKPKYDSEVRTINEEYKKLQDETNSFEMKVKAVKLLCQFDYIQNSEMDVVKYLVRKPTKVSSLAEVKTSMAMDPSKLQLILENLAKWKVIEFDQSAQMVTLTQKIDLFDGGN